MLAVANSGFRDYKMDDKTIKKSLRYSLLDGMFASIMLSISETFITPYAIALKASAAQIAALSSMPNLAASLMQVKSASLVERFGSRKTLINFSVLLHTLMWLPMIAIPYLVPSDGDGFSRPVLLILFYTLFVALGGVSFPAWSSLMADHVQETERGRVFGWRNRVFGFIHVLSMFSAGLFLYFFKRLGANGFLGFSIIFFIAFISRLISWNFLTKMHEPQLKINREDRFTMLDFLKRMKNSNFGRFVIFVAAMNFATLVAGPFFSVLMLRELKFNYLTYTTIIMAATLTNLVVMKIWGMRADLVGNRRILRLTSFFIPLIPILWLFSQNVFYLVLVQIYAGFFWAGFNLSASNFIYDAVTPEKRTRCIAYFNVINGVAIFSGATLGGILLKFLPPIFGYKILTLLLLSGVLRILAAGLCSFVKEVRKVKEVSNLELFYAMLGLKLSPSLSIDKQ